MGKEVPGVGCMRCRLGLSGYALHDRLAVRCLHKERGDGLSAVVSHWPVDYAVDTVC